MEVAALANLFKSLFVLITPLNAGFVGNVTVLANGVAVLDNSANLFAELAALRTDSEINCVIAKVFYL